MFTYFNEGEYDVTLQIMTSDGCRDTIQFIDLVEYTIPNAEVHYNTQICLHEYILSQIQTEIILFLIGVLIQLTMMV